MTDTAADALLDTKRTVETPEGCRIDLRAAGPVSRTRAWLIDFAIRAGVYLVAGQILLFLGKGGGGLMLLLMFALEWLYPTVFEALHGATPGKRACKLAVLRDDGTPMDWGASFIRNTLRFIDFLPFLYAFGAASMFLTRDFKRLGDLAAGTVVVYCDEPVLPKLAAEGPSDPPPVPLTVSEQRAVIAYALREQQLTRERSAELASLAVPLTAGLPAEAARTRLVAIGRFLLGRA
jgi:uncharacterized RDD family membrane protein YckC